MSCFLQLNIWPRNFDEKVTVIIRAFHDDFDLLEFVNNAGDRFLGLAAARTKLRIGWKPAFCSGLGISLLATWHRAFAVSFAARL